jgi:hypothetical protein
MMRSDLFPSSSHSPPPSLLRFPIKMVPTCTTTALSKASLINSIAAGTSLVRKRKSFSMRTNSLKGTSTVTLGPWSQAHPIDTLLTQSTTLVSSLLMRDLLTLSSSPSGNEKYDIRIKSLASESEEDLDVIRECGSSVEWGNDDSTIFYTKLDEELRSFQIWLHTIGSFPPSPPLPSS